MYSRRFALLLLLMVVLLPSSVGAEKTKLKQQILPMDCVFEVVDYGTGEIRFLTPDECGVVVPPVPVSPLLEQNGAEAEVPVSNSVNSVFGIPGLLTLPNVKAAGKAINLDRYDTFRSAEGYTVTVRAGQTYYFREILYSGAIQRVTSVYISKITSNTVRVVVNGKHVHELQAKQTRSYDINKDSKADFFIRVVSVNAQQSAALNFRFYQEPISAQLTPANKNKDNWSVPAAITTLIGLSVAWYWIRRNRNL